MADPRPPLTRSRRHRMIAGVCGGLAERWGWRPGHVRLLFIVTTVLPAVPGLPLYLLLWLLVPAEPASPAPRMSPAA